MLGLICTCQKCIVNKLDVLTELNKIKDPLEQEIEKMRERKKGDTREDEDGDE